MQLYKSRGFSDFFQDTFAFLKENGKHIYKHYLIVNGIFLLILLGITYVFTKFYTDIIFGDFMTGGSSTIENYMNENMGLFILIIILFVVAALTAGIISFAFIPIYLQLYEKHGKNFGTSEIVSLYKSNIGKLLIFVVCGFLLAIPLLFFMGITLFILAITIIGFLLMPLVIGGVSLYYNMALMEYIEDKRSIWESFGYSLSLMSKKFWAAVGSVGLFWLIAYVLQNIVSLIPYIFGMASIFAPMDNAEVYSQQDIGASMTILMLVVFFLSFIVGIFLGVIVQLNQGIVFYSLKEDMENINTKSVIDEIGSGE